jgi:serine/threonine protein kinase
MFALLGREGGKFSSPTAMYYAAAVASVLEYLHARSVAYRDLKPENIVFDRFGHLKVGLQYSVVQCGAAQCRAVQRRSGHVGPLLLSCLRGVAPACAFAWLQVADFGFAKVVKDKTYTLCGTPEYLAPELVQGNGTLAHTPTLPFVWRAGAPVVFFFAAA